jgi:outer membrane protein
MTAAVLLALALAAPGDVLTLDDALLRARDHAEVVAARAAIGVASARVDQARAGFLPSVAAAATAVAGTDNKVPGPSEARAQRSDVLHSSYGATVALSQPLWDFGRTAGAVHAAALAVRAAESDVAVTRSEIGFQVRTAYYAALTAEALLVAADETVRQMEQHLLLATEAHAVGQRALIDVTRAQVDVSSARIARIQAASATAAARSALSAAIGAPVGDVALVAPAEADGDPAPEVAAREALARRPELVALDRRVAAQEAAAGAARAAFLPVLGASAEVSWRGAEPPLVRNYVGAVTLTFPLVSGGADLGRLREAERTGAQLRAERAALALRIGAEAEQAALAVSEARARRDVADVLLGQARENLALAEGRYQSGAGSIIELTDAQAALTGARGQAVRAGFDVGAARARLLRALGGS